MRNLIDLMESHAYEMRHGDDRMDERVMDAAAVIAQAHDLRAMSKEVLSTEPGNLDPVLHRFLGGAMDVLFFAATHMERGDLRDAIQALRDRIESTPWNRWRDRNTLLSVVNEVNRALMNAERVLHAKEQRG